MIEFTIIFNYDNLDQKAGVVKSCKEMKTEYDIRPVEPETVKKFGKQIILYEEAGNFNAGNHIDEDYIVFFNSLVAAIKEQDIENVDL